MVKNKIYLLILLPILMACVMLFVGCGATFTGLTTRFLAEGERETTFFEQSTYALSHDIMTNKNGLAFDLDAAASSLLVTIEGDANLHLANSNIDSQFNGEGYKYRTVLTIRGRYTYNNQERPINNIITTDVYFAAARRNFRPLYSSQTIQTTTPEYNAKTKGYDFKDYNYTVVKEYNNDSSSAFIQITNILPVAPNTTAIQESTKTVHNLKKTNAPFDSTQLYFTARTMNDKLNTVNAVTENGVVATSINLNTQKEKLTFPNTNAEAEYDVTLAAISITGNTIAKGPGKILSFLTSGNFKHALYRIKEVLPYALGSITYTLSSITKTPPTP